MISCKELVTFMIDYLDGALDFKASQEFDLHSVGCLDCHAFLNTYKKTVSLLNSLPCEEIPAELSIRIGTFLREKRGR
jgi:hypothetical protein